MRTTLFLTDSWIWLHILLYIMICKSEQFNSTEIDLGSRNHQWDWLRARREVMEYMAIYHTSIYIFKYHRVKGFIQRDLQSAFDKSPENADCWKRSTCGWGPPMCQPSKYWNPVGSMQYKRKTHIKVNLKEFILSLWLLTAWMKEQLHTSCGQLTVGWKSTHRPGVIADNTLSVFFLLPAAFFLLSWILFSFIRSKNTHDFRKDTNIMILIIIIALNHCDAINSSVRKYLLQTSYEIILKGNIMYINY